MEQEKLKLEIAKVEPETKIETKVENKPTDEDIERFEKEFSDAVEEFENKQWQIGDESNAEKYLEFMIEFVDKYVYWTKNLWMGVCKLYEELESIKTKITDTKTLMLTYQALEFTHHILSNPAGFGLQSARDIAKRAEEFNELFNVVDVKAKEAREMLKTLQQKQDKVSASIQGFFLEDLTQNLEPEVEPVTCENCEGECKCEK